MVCASNSAGRCEIVLAMVRGSLAGNDPVDAALALQHLGLDHEAELLLEGAAYGAPDRMRLPAGLGGHLLDGRPVRALGKSIRIAYFVPLRGVPSAFLDVALRRGLLAVLPAGWRFAGWMPREIFRVIEDLLIGDLLWLRRRDTAALPPP